jgi:hypothetical protein
MWELLKIVFDVVSPGAWGYIQQTGAALQSILKNPLPFVGNLVKAAKAGFQNFAGHFLTHLKNGLIDWLTGSLTGIYIPKALTPLEFGKMAISVLGVSWAQIRGKLVKALGPNGEFIMTGLEAAFDIIQALVNGGPKEAWEVLKDKLTGLKDQIVSGITSMVVEAVTTKAVPKFIAMFIPGAGFISAIISIYDIVMVFVEKISKIIEVVNAFVSSIVQIAAGNIAGAAAKVESVLAGLLTLAINFLAGFAGLGKIASKVRGIVERVRGTVDKGLDAAIAFIIGKAKKLFSWLFEGKKDKDGKDVKAKVAKELSARLGGGVKTAAPVGAALGAVYAKYQKEGLKKLHLVEGGTHPGEFEIHAVASPGAKVGKVEAALGIDPFDLQLQEQDAGTSLTAKLNSMDLGPHESKGAAVHAEDSLLSVLKANWDDLVAKSGAKAFTLYIKITRSPCGRCGGRLGSFLDGKRRAGKNQGYTVDMTIAMASLYGGQQTKPGKTNYLSLQKLHAKGVELKVYDVVQALEESGIKNVNAAIGKAGAKEYLDKRLEALRKVLKEIKGQKAG